MLIRRPDYEQKVMRYFETPLIKVLTGVRRCGKSSILKLVAQEAIRRGADERNVVMLRLDELGMPFNVTSEWLAETIDARLQLAGTERMAYVFLDEIQDVPEWERVVRQLQTRRNTDIYLTGSNAYMLSSELSTMLSGRYVEIAVNPLSFGEYLNFKHQHGMGIGSTSESFAEYLRFGGMPGQFDFAGRDRETMLAFLEGIFDSVLLNDVAKRAQVSDIDLLEKLVSYLFGTSGNLFSTKKIADTLTSAGRKTAPRTIDNYIDALEHALIMREAPQFRLKGKSALNPKRKFYPADTGLRNFAAGFPTDDIGFQLENVVFNELFKRGYTMSVGTLSGNPEIDFVARKVTGERLYVQVTQSLLDDSVYERELAPLRMAADSFPKIVLTLDGFRTGITREGIRIQGLIDWLLETIAEDAEAVAELHFEQYSAR